MAAVGGGAADPADPCGRTGADVPLGWGSEAPRHGRFDPYGEMPAEDGSADDADGGTECDEPPEPQWVLDAEAEDLRERLAAAVHAPAGMDAARVIEVLSGVLPGAASPSGDPSCSGAVDAAGLVDGIRVAARLVNHYQAVQQQWMAALARPGVGVPLAQVVDLCRHPGRTVPGALRPPGELPDDLPRGGDGEPDLRPLVDHPAWRAALADTAARLASAEVGGALRLAPVTARARVERALLMVDELPATHTAQYRGDLDGYRASIIADRTDVLSGPQRRRVEGQVLPGAGSRTPAVLRDQVDRAVVAADPDAAARRVERARAGRGVRLDNARDDMAEFRALLGCTDGHLAFGVLDEQASALTAAGMAAGRGASQLRADVFCDLFRALARTGHAHLAAPRPETRPERGPDTDPIAADGAPRRAGAETPGRTPHATDPDTTGSATTDATKDSATTDSATTEPDTFNSATTNSDTTGSVASERAENYGATGDGTPGTRIPGNSVSGNPAPGDHTGPGDRFTGVEPCHGYCTDSPGGYGRGGPSGTVAGRRRRIALNVYLDAATLAGLDDRPGELAGYGTITAGTARALAASADTVRALIVQPLTDGADAPGEGPPDPGRARHTGHSDNPARARTCGTVLDAGRAVYRPPEAVLDYVAARDRTCTWPGCRAPGRRCDADHRRAFHDGGATCACNLDLLCRWHHRVKTFTAWRAEPGPDGVLVWTSPTGHRYPAEPGHPMPIPPDGSEPPGTGPPREVAHLAGPDEETPPF